MTYDATTWNKMATGLTAPPTLEPQRTACQMYIDLS